MDLRHLRSFVAVADAGGVSRAAPRLRITQPALSRQLRDLEGSLGVALFDRIGRRLELTAHGEDLLRRVRDVLAAADALVDRARALESGDAGILRVGATPQTLESVIAPFLRQHRRTHPGTDVRIVEAGGLELLGRLDRGEVQLALSIAGEGFEHRPLFPARLLAAMASGHPLAAQRRLDVAALSEQPLLVLRREFGSRLWLDAAFELARLRPRLVLESSSAHALLALARAGQGIAVVPSTVLHGSGLYVAPLVQQGRAIGRWVAVNWDGRRFLPPRGRAFVEELAAHCARKYPGREYAARAPLPREAGGGPR
jgi:DNA-binding transcriptional LysR family regulator